jgi:hypothetical protein
MAVLLSYWTIYIFGSWLVPPASSSLPHGWQLFRPQEASENFLALNAAECQQLPKSPSLQWLTAK